MPLAGAPWGLSRHADCAEVPEAKAHAWRIGRRLCAWRRCWRRRRQVRVCYTTEAFETAAETCTFHPTVEGHLLIPRRFGSRMASEELLVLSQPGDPSLVVSSLDVVEYVIEEKG